MIEDSAVVASRAIKLDPSAVNTAKADEIIKMFKEQVFASGIGGTQEDRRHRATKIICTVGKTRNTPKDIKELMQAGMDVVRLNMDYFDIEKME